MKAWPVEEAKVRFSELLVACLRDGPQLVTKRGEDTAVIVRIEQWRRLSAETQPSLKELLLADYARSDDFVVPPRGPIKGRRPPNF